MLTPFALLPRDLLEVEVLDRLDDITILLLQVALCRRESITFFDVNDEYLQYQIVDNGPRIMMYFHERQLITKPYRSRERAARIGNLEMLKFIDHNSAFHEYPPSTALNVAFDEQHYDCVKYLLETDKRASTSSVDRAFQTGNLSIVKLLADRGFTFKTDEFTSMECAISSRSLPCLQYLYEHGIALKSDYIEYAVAEHRSDALYYLLSINCPYDPEVCLKHLENYQQIVIDIELCPADDKDPDDVLNDYECREIYKWLLSI